MLLSDLLLTSSIVMFMLSSSPRPQKKCRTGRHMFPLTSPIPLVWPSHLSSSSHPYPPLLLCIRCLAKGYKGVITGMKCLITPQIFSDQQKYGCECNFLLPLTLLPSGAAIISKV